MRCRRANGRRNWPLSRVRAPTRSLSATPAGVPAGAKGRKIAVGSQNDRLKRLHKKNPRCHYCKRPTKLMGQNLPNKATLDHIVPLSRGGSPDGGPNTVLACNECNSAKGNATLEEFLTSDYMKERST
jgi:5-methylcytosine-specific restriction endonuclease McrA